MQSLNNPDCPTRRVLVFLKEPVPGRVKTRLARDLGDEAAVAVYERLVAATLSQLSEIPIRILFDPPEGKEAVEAWLGRISSASPSTSWEWEAQYPGDLGERLEQAFASAFESGASPVLAVGTDCPTLSPALLDEACSRLEKDEADLVVGPAPDGGYYLIGVSQHRPELFREIPWSSPDTLSSTLASAEEQGLRVTLLPEREDIDDLPSLNRACEQMPDLCTGMEADPD